LSPVAVAAVVVEVTVAAALVVIDLLFLENHQVVVFLQNLH